MVLKKKKLPVIIKIAPKKVFKMDFFTNRKHVDAYDNSVDIEKEVIESNEAWKVILKQNFMSYLTHVIGPRCSKNGKINFMAPALGMKVLLIIYPHEQLKDMSTFSSAVLIILCPNQHNDWLQTQCLLNRKD